MTHESRAYDSASEPVPPPSVGPWQVVPEKPRDDALPHVSPSLLPARGKVTAYEIKFLIDPDVALRVERWALEHMALDPHADPNLENAYRIYNIYFDTDQFDTFHRTPSYRRRKYRIRSYGAGGDVFLERKTKSGDRVAKRRVPVARGDLPRLANAVADPQWTGYWFHQRLLQRQLRPKAQLSYTRVAHVGVSPDGPIRLTLDREIHCAPAQGFEWSAAARGIPILPDLVILELKFRLAMPALFKSLVEETGLVPAGASKYRLGVQVWGMTPAAKQAG